jgi:hypothetical protein
MKEADMEIEKINHIKTAKTLNLRLQYSVAGVFGALKLFFHN